MENFKPLENRESANSKTHRATPFLKAKKINLLLFLLIIVAGIKVFVTEEITVRGIVQHGPHVRIIGISGVIIGGYLILRELRKLKRN